MSKASKSPEADPLLAAARSAAPEEAQDQNFESTFVDAVSRDLARGRFLLLIVGDGIHESVEEMALFLHNAPHLGFTLALVEIALFKADVEGSDDLFVQPRVLVRTREVNRAVFEIRSSGGQADVMSVRMPESAEVVSRKPTARASLTDEAYLEQFLGEFERTHGSALTQMVKETITAAPAIGLRADCAFPQGPQLKFDDDESEKSFNFGQLTRSATLGSSQRLSWMCAKLGLPANIWQDYHAALVRLVPGARRLPAHERNIPDFERIADASGQDLSLKLLLPHREQWFTAITRTIDALRAATSDRLP